MKVGMGIGWCQLQQQPFPQQPTPAQATAAPAAAPCSLRPRPPSLGGSSTNWKVPTSLPLASGVVGPSE